MKASILEPSRIIFRDPVVDGCRLTPAAFVRFSPDRRKRRPADLQAAAVATVAMPTLDHYPPSESVAYRRKIRRAS